jgi:hypothetical protein
VPCQAATTKIAAWPLLRELLVGRLFLALPAGLLLLSTGPVQEPKSARGQGAARLRS